LLLCEFDDVTYEYQRLSLFQGKYGNLVKSGIQKWSGERKWSGKSRGIFIVGDNWCFSYSQQLLMRLFCLIPVTTNEVWMDQVRNSMSSDH